MSTTQLLHKNKHTNQHYNRNRIPYIKMNSSTTFDLTAIANINDEGLGMYADGRLGEAQSVFVRVLSLLRTKLRDDFFDNKDDFEPVAMKEITLLSVSTKVDNILFHDKTLFYTDAFRLDSYAIPYNVPTITSLTAITLYNLALVSTLRGIEKKRNESFFSKASTLYNQSLTILDCYGELGPSFTILTAAIYTNMAYIQEEIFSNKAASSSLICCLEETVLFMVTEYYYESIYCSDIFELFFRVIYFSATSKYPTHAAMA